MKKILIITIIILAAIFGVYKAMALVSSNNSSIFSDKKVLIVYYSYSGNTKTLAQKIQNLTGGDLLEIKTKNEYPKDYNTMTTLVQEDIKTGKLPELQNSGDISNYEIIFVGTPVWWGSVSLPVKAFLAQNNLENKTIIPFCTHGGGGADKTFEDIKKLALKAKFLDSFSTNGNSIKTSKVQNWISNLK